MQFCGQLYALTAAGNTVFFSCKQIHFSYCQSNYADVFLVVTEDHTEMYRLGRGSSNSCLLGKAQSSRGVVCVGQLAGGRVQLNSHHLPCSIGYPTLFLAIVVSYRMGANISVFFMEVCSLTKVV